MIRLVLQLHLQLQKGFITYDAGLFYENVFSIHITHVFFSIIMKILIMFEEELTA